MFSAEFSFVTSLSLQVCSSAYNLRAVSGPSRQLKEYSARTGKRLFSGAIWERAESRLGAGSIARAAATAQSRLLPPQAFSQSVLKNLLSELAAHTQQIQCFQESTEFWENMKYSHVMCAQHT